MNTIPNDNVSIQAVAVPRLVYGTAWKEDQTERLTGLAMEQGFRGIDTANQRKHYHEAAVGRAVAAAIARGHVTRQDLFLQTKFTFRRGQDHRLPYDPDAPIATQVEQSFQRSLEHLQCGFVDSYLLHGPASSVGLTPDDWAAWRAMEAIHDSGRARTLGISNVTLDQLQLLCREARVPPRFVQNRCYAVKSWDRSIRKFCERQEIVYQGFSLLTANRKVLASSQIAQIAARHGRTAAQVIFRFAMQVNMIALTGTTSADHMRADLQVFQFSLDPEEVNRIERMAVR